MDKDCSELGVLFQETISNIKGSFSVWEEFTNKAAKLNSAIKVMLTASVAYHEAFMKLGDLGNGTRGAARDIGSVLTRLCLRNQVVESKLKAYAVSLIDLMVVPIQKSLDDWQKTVVQLDKDHSRDYKKAHSDLKKAAGETVRLQKKVKKGKVELQLQLDEATRDTNMKFTAMEDVEKHFVAAALVEERSHLALLASCLKPVLDHELTMLSEVNHLQEIADCLGTLSDSGSTLPPVAEHVIEDAAKGQSSENKKKSSKEDRNIEVVMGTLRVSKDSSIHMQLTDLPNQNSMDVQSSPPSEIYMKRSHSIQYSGRPGLMSVVNQFNAANAVESQMPYESCQSLQCSSGYGTMTNISTGSNEAAGYTTVYDTLEESYPPYDLSKLSKYSTLPNRRPFVAGKLSEVPAYRATGSVLTNQAFNRAATCTESGQLPPMPLQRQASFCDSDDDFPLPPPPEDLYPHEQQTSKGHHCLEATSQRKASLRSPVVADVMHSLATTLHARNSMGTDTELNRASSWSDKSSGYSASGGDADDEEESAFAKQLRTVRLKRAESHDRSAPRLQRI